MDVLMSSEPQLLRALAGLRTEGFECAPLTLNVVGDWLWVADGTTETAAAIAKIVLRVDQEAKTI